MNENMKYFPSSFYYLYLYPYNTYIYYIGCYAGCYDATIRASA